MSLHLVTLLMIGSLTPKKLTPKTLHRYIKYSTMKFIVYRYPIIDLNLLLQNSDQKISPSNDLRLQVQRPDHAACWANGSLHVRCTHVDSRFSHLRWGLDAFGVNAPKIFAPGRARA